MTMKETVFERDDRMSIEGTEVEEELTAGASKRISSSSLGFESNEKEAFYFISFF